jgi:D-serine deaminase-like pyridoxal phosphate-dependent protein
MPNPALAFVSDPASTLDFTLDHRHKIDEAMALPRALHASPFVRLGGIECYEGRLATCDCARDMTTVTGLVRTVKGERMRAVCAADGLFEGDEAIISAGGSAVFDLVEQREQVTSSLQAEL